MSTPAVVSLEGVSKIYGSGEAAVAALRSVDLAVKTGEYVAIMGASGSGKSTMMNIIGCLDKPTSGRYELQGHDVSGIDEDTLSMVRSRLIGFVFQSFHLIPRMTAAANVELPLLYGGVGRDERRDRVSEVLDLVGLSDRASHRPNELSGGQQQRVAVGRALTMNPPLLLADEPTGNLDSTASADVMAMFDALHDEGRTIVLITHEDSVAEHARRIVQVSDGQIISDVLREPQGPVHMGAPA
ncbi:MAG TPA: ABC transporter ATP-binding protein [Aeromicrobium sp.]|nr:ABC transporter ATP-binding protein [Aeromicrobium sp.]HKY58873.1 ABC transporter ATP-binding protein [Aeromicrobium sp.]